MNNEEIDFTDANMLRSKAEEKLKSTQREKAFSDREINLQKLVHELQVHQIELEMQNEELRHAYETAEAALENYTLLFDLAPIGFSTLDSEAAICELNFTAADMLGEMRFKLIGANLKLFILQSSLTVFTDFLRKVYSSNSKESCEVVLGYDKKPLCAVYMEGVVTEKDKKWDRPEFCVNDSTRFL